MPNKKLIEHLGFIPKENASAVFIKKYPNHEDYSLEVDFDNKKINYGDLIKSESKSTQNFSQAENWVVLECVNRLLEKGYAPSNIVLEKTWATGRGTSGRLDVLVKRPEGKSFLMIECKTWGNEFENEQKKIRKDGGQVFTYFQQDTNADVLMLYASEFDGAEIRYINSIIKIEEHYRSAGNVEDVHDRWDKTPKNTGIFDDWVDLYNFQNKLILKRNLKPISNSISSTIFHEFLSILRKHSVSDKPNAFNKIFNLFLAKIYDEKKRSDESLEFQWKENQDDPISFQIRLINLYQLGMKDFLKKEVEGIHDDDFRYENEEELKVKKKKWLKYNNVFAIKEVVDDESFDDNQRVLKEVVTLLQEYQVRYPRKQQHLSDFFERLLTTGLKQESGQFFTPPPITRFITRSLPIKDKILAGLNDPSPSLPAVIDFAVGSGHFITEMMEAYQSVIESLDTKDFYEEAISDVETWKIKKYSWASSYIYGIEKDYRLVKVAKVGCYFYGDGLAQVVHGDGLDSFENSRSFVGLLKQKKKSPDNGQFSFVVSNPPYSVTTFKGDLRNSDAKDDFDLFKYLTDRSSEIECLFVERTKQLLAVGGVAAVILPSSILSNSGIYTKTREIIFKYFEIIAITELGSNTFMATGTNTVILFLKRRNNAFWENYKLSVDNFAENLRDVTINGIENPVHKYVVHVWEGLEFDDYVSLMQRVPNEKVKEHELFKEYDTKIKAKDRDEKFDKIINLELEKLLYFIMAYPQRIVIVKTGGKKEEKQFLGYEFSNRRGSEGIHPIQRSKTIDECTRLFDPEIFDNPEKASTYILNAFSDDPDFEIHDDLKKNISRVDLVDMMSFDRVDFEKSVSLAVKKKVEIKSKYDQIRLSQITSMIKRGKSPKYGQSQTQIIKSGQARGYYNYDFSEKHFVSSDYIVDDRKLQKGDLLFNSSGVGTAGRVTYFNFDGDYVVDSHITILRFDKNMIIPKYALNLFGHIGFKNLEELALGQSGQIEISRETISNFKIPLPPIEIQEKIVSEIEVLEKREVGAKEEIGSFKNEILSIVENLYTSNYTKQKLGELAEIKNGGTPSTKINEYWSGGISWATLVDTKNKYLNKTARNISNKGLAKSSAVLLPVNTVLFSSRATIGDVSIANIEVSTNQGYKNFICNPEKLEYEYLYYVLKNEAKNIESLASGMTYPEISKTLISGYKIPLPSLSEQKIILSKINKFEDKIENLEEQIASIPKEKEQILKKYLE